MRTRKSRYTTTSSVVYKILSHSIAYRHCIDIASSAVLSSGAGDLLFETLVELGDPGLLPDVSRNVQSRQR